MFRYFKFYIQKIFSAKYVRKGKCNKCGNCCRNILLYVEDEPIKTDKQFEKVKEWEKHYNSFYISGKSENGALLFTCKEIDENNRCKVYFFRGLGCRMYPKKDTKFLINGGKPLDGCGYYFEPDKKFKSFLIK
ncbi:MAG: YkgJ family cysteine cluster protein [Candidatus Gastranaerophilales bacterium]|nr:YkgJ family cysteine cluster protein [Candidatus Gastranaerophilales bacterium]